MALSKCPKGCLRVLCRRDCWASLAPIQPPAAAQSSKTRSGMRHPLCRARRLSNQNSPKVQRLAKPSQASAMGQIISMAQTQASAKGRNKKGRREAPPFVFLSAFKIAIQSDQTLRFGMICFLRLITPGRTTLSPETSAPKLLAATDFTRSFGTSSVASSRRISTTNKST